MANLRGAADITDRIVHLATAVMGALQGGDVQASTLSIVSSVPK